jgi:hypothetical protein
MTTLAQAYEEYKKSEPHATIIEPQCLKTGCEGDIYRGRIVRLEAKIALMTEALKTFADGRNWFCTSDNWGNEVIVWIGVTNRPADIARDALK